MDINSIIESIEKLLPHKIFSDDHKKVLLVLLDDHKSYKEKISFLKRWNNDKCHDALFTASDIRTIANKTDFFHINDALKIVNAIDKKFESIDLIIKNLYLKNNIDISRYYDYIIKLILDHDLENILYVWEWWRWVCLLGIKKKSNHFWKKYQKFFIVKLSKLKTQNRNTDGNLIYEFDQHKSFLSVLQQRYDSYWYTKRFHIPKLANNNTPDKWTIIMEYISWEPLSNILIIKEYAYALTNIIDQLNTHLNTDTDFVISIIFKLSLFGIDISDNNTSDIEILRWLDKKDLQKIIKWNDSSYQPNDKKYVPKDSEILSLMCYYLEFTNSWIKQKDIMSECKKTLQEYNLFLTFAKNKWLSHNDRNIGNILIWVDNNTPFIGLIDYWLPAQNE